MNRALRLTVVAATMAALITGVAYAANLPIPENQPEVKLQNTTNSQLPGDTAALEAALQASGPVNYKILIIDNTEGEDKTAYLDRAAEKWGVPPSDTLYLIIYARDNFDVRFYMGADFRTKNLTVDEMLTLVRTHYLARSQKGDPAGGLADLIQAVNQRMGSAPAATGDKKP